MKFFIDLIKVFFFCQTFSFWRESRVCVVFHRHHHKSAERREKKKEDIIRSVELSFPFLFCCCCSVFRLAGNGPSHFAQQQSRSMKITQFANDSEISQKSVDINDYCSSSLPRLTQREPQRRRGARRTWPISDCADESRLAPLMNLSPAPCGSE